MFLISIEISERSAVGSHLAEKSDGICDTVGSIGV